MTQNTKKFVRNAEFANLEHVPTFSEVYAMPYVRESIESILDQNVRNYQILGGFKDDLRQEILIHLNNELPKYDPEKSAIQTFARLAVVSGMRMARRKYFTRDNHTLTFAQPIENFESYDENDEALNGEDCRAFASHSHNNVDWHNQTRDIETVIAMMPDDLRKITRMLLNGNSVLCVCRRLGIPNSTFRDNHLRQIRAFFSKTFFEKNAKNSVN